MSSVTMMGWRRALSMLGLAGSFQRFQSGVACGSGAIFCGDVCLAARTGGAILCTFLIASVSCWGLALCSVLHADALLELRQKTGLTLVGVSAGGG